MGWRMRTRQRSQWEGVRSYAVPPYLHSARRGRRRPGHRSRAAHLSFRAQTTAPPRIEAFLPRSGVFRVAHSIGAAERGPAVSQVGTRCIARAKAEQIAAGNVIGWFQGRMEWGPRALGNRSIVAHPGLPNMKDVLNARIKHREWFRPFAPSIMADHQHDYFEHDHPSPFMLHVYKIRPEKRKELCAVNHVDDTGRLQTVTREENPMYYDLISAFHRKTGIPVILNTSFNENEPIVCTPEEAIDCFQRTRMDVLAIGPVPGREAKWKRREFYRVFGAYGRRYLAGNPDWNYFREGQSR